MYGLRSRPRWWTCLVDSRRCSAAVVAAIDPEFAGIARQRADEQRNVRSSSSCNAPADGREEQRQR